MAYDLEEQEQLDAFKTWWKRNGNVVVALAGIAVVGFGGYEGWQYYQHQQSAAASAQYQTMARTDIKDVKTIKALSSELMDKYSSTPYAGRAAVAVAKVNYQEKDLASAKAQLDWAAKNAKEDAVRAVALLQLAAIQFEEKAYDEALKTLGEKHDEGFDGLFADLKGDVLVAQGKPDDAKTAYKDALAKLDMSGDYYKYTEHKLEALGS
ncbi:tetratricopeptide repeat protein [Methylobacillus gramineus]|uniref:YfgM family protein n=1 Tax=Methylobacillus gramineus TaxID=755169 RepID=UPI001CFFA6BF|nr:tetratricopeptide repeat protein [Methylobacillus gramineus]MCB5184152.1 tetratricopeptide repeat protein [Methylobacillus gramineus]